MKKMLYSNLVKKSNETTRAQNQLGSGYRELVKAQGLENLEFHQTILLWHIVTDVCYYCDDNKDAPENVLQLRESKRLSDYMFYLLVKQRQMLPIGTGLPSLQDTFVEAITYCEQQKTSTTLFSNVSEACKTLLQRITKDKEYVANHPKGRSVFRYAFVVAYDLLTRGNMKKIWEFSIELWIEILNYSAVQCRVDRHAQQLRFGGEFISHVWILQFYACLLEQFQLTQPLIEDEDIDLEEIP